MNTKWLINEAVEVVVAMEVKEEDMVAKGEDTEVDVAVVVEMNVAGTKPE